METDALVVIRRAVAEDWDNAMELAFRVFLKYEAEEYGPEGTRNFAQFLTDEDLKKMFLAGEYLLFVAETEGKLVGLISLRSKNHISLLFVDEKYHRKGIGTALVKHLQEYMLQNTKQQKLTVFASPYGVPFYHKTGFADIGKETHKDGIIYTPMEFYL